MVDIYSWMEGEQRQPPNDGGVRDDVILPHSGVSVLLSWMLAADGPGWRLYGEQTMQMHGQCAAVCSRWRAIVAESEFWVKLGIAFGFEGPPQHVKTIVGNCVCPLQQLNRRVREKLAELRGEPEQRDSKSRGRIKVCVMGAEKELCIQLAHRLADVSLGVERPLWESARFVPASRPWQWGKRAWESTDVVIWWEFRDAPTTWAEDADAVVIAHATDTNPGQIREDVLSVQEELREAGVATGCPIFLVVSGEVAKGDPWWIARAGEEAGCAHAMGLVAAGACHFGGEEAAIDGVWPCTLKPDYGEGEADAGPVETVHRDGITVLREAIASCGLLVQHHKGVLDAGRGLVQECETRIATLASRGGSSCLQCGEPLLPLWRPAVACAKCRLNFCFGCVVSRSRLDLHRPGQGVVHLCRYCTRVLDWLEAHEQVGDGHAVWRSNGRLAIVEEVDHAMQEISQIQKAHTLKQLLSG